MKREIRTMTMSLRYRIVLTLLPLLALLALIGTSGAVLLHRLGGRIELILRENYDSVIAMERLNEALERIDSSFQFALAGREKLARDQFEQNQRPYEDALELERRNITLEGEQELFDELSRLSDLYRSEGKAFYRLPAQDARRHAAYFGTDGLLARFNAIKTVSGEILRINQDNMEQASRDAKQTAKNSLIGFGFGLAATAALAALLAWRTIADIVRPIRAVTDSALAISRGNLDQVIAVASRDELGDLAESFNLMARQMRHYRQTDFARLLRAQRTSQATIDSFPDPVLVVDPESCVELANPAARRLFGVTSKKDEEPPITWQPPAPLREPLQEALRQQWPYVPEGFDHAVVLSVDGASHSYLPRVLPIRDPYGNTLGAAVLLMDVTRYRLLDQVKSDLVATVSHELKTPLTTVRLAIHLLLEETIGPLTPKQMELLLDARDNAERLLGMVNNLLDLTRLEEGRRHLNLQPQSPRELLTAAADAIRPRADAKNIRVNLEAPPELPAVSVDAQQLGHALDNLLDNALTHTERGGQISLAAANVGSRIVLTVADTGRGIAPEHLSHLFERFYRIPGQSEETGTGLGLAIVREIVAAHGGKITCESTLGAGTVFRIELPV
jgi:signal transduction histidine kinase/HAMP domain-containing protein